MYFTMRAQSLAHPWNGSDRAWLCRWLEVTTASLQELHQMRQEAEQRVRGVLGDGHCMVSHSAAEERGAPAASTVRRHIDPEDLVGQVPELGHIQEEEGDVRLWGYKEKGHNNISLGAQGRPEFPILSCKFLAGQAQGETAHHGRTSAGQAQGEPAQHNRPSSGQDQGEPAHHGRTSAGQDQGEPAHHGRTSAGQAQGVPAHHGRTSAGQAQGEPDHHGRTSAGQAQGVPAHHGRTSAGQTHWRTSAGQNQEKKVVTGTMDKTQGPTWARSLAAEAEVVDHMEEIPVLNEGSERPLSVFSSEPASLRRIGSGSLAPRLRLGSSGVTSDLLYTRRMSGNCLSAHSSGFYETSDLDSTSSSCSSLCSDTSCHTSTSVMSPHRSLSMRPRSIDCAAERRKELQNGRVQTKRPMSAGAVDGFFLLSVYNSRCDITQSNHTTPYDYPFSDPPPLCAIQQRCKAERYICKLALKYRCKPGVTTLPADLGPPNSRRQVLPFLHPDCHASCPLSPQVSSISISLGDVRKHPRGSWGRFLSRIMLRRDSRSTASELNLDQCGQSPQGTLRGSPLAESQLLRAKSVRDLLSVNPFKRSQRGLNKAW
ncbi:uncharacterized protein LOC134969203 [Pseudophryne corroboree]|uniref:uncharacterized protein LOC134969203 n=1 Tax=Pseudophryne corroboree TaxID=495146 RepID=UPI00308135CD